jgi:hypothetical protein
MPRRVELSICDVCQMMISWRLLDLARWQGKDYRVCKDCIKGLENRIEEVGLKVEDILPGSVELD